MLVIATNFELVPKNLFNLYNFICKKEIHKIFIQLLKKYTIKRLSIPFIPTAQNIIRYKTSTLIKKHFAKTLSQIRFGSIVCSSVQEQLQWTPKKHKFCSRSINFRNGILRQTVALINLFYAILLPILQIFR